MDGQLSEDFANENNLVRKKDENGNNVGGYLEPDKRNIRALKLRGEKSDGLILPITVLAKYTDITNLKDGDQITVLDGREICKKYIPQNNNNKPHFSNTKVSKIRKKNIKKFLIPFSSNTKILSSLRIINGHLEKMT